MIFEKDKIVNKSDINLLAKRYNTLDYNIKLAALLKSIYPLEYFEHLPKYELHKLLNDIFIKNYNGEEILKYKLFQCHLKKSNIIGAFEIKVNNSRVDFLTINGNTTSFEIKSELDNLSKLNKQIADYILAFEYNYLVIDEKHIKKTLDLLPVNFGLWSYNNGKFKKIKKAELNQKINPEIQLKLLTKKELVNSFPLQNGIIKEILKNCDFHSINCQFKKTLKNRYQNRWDFIISNQDCIFPIDIQFFFNKNIQPSFIYFH